MGQNLISAPQLLHLIAPAAPPDVLAAATPAVAAADVEVAGAAVAPGIVANF